MKHKHLIGLLDEPRILAAISAAEARTTGPIWVMVSKQRCPDALSAAQKRFKAMKLNRAPHHNAVLIFVAPKSQTFAVWGGAALHEHTGSEFWNTLRDEIAICLKESRFTDALIHAIAETGERLASHFPKTPQDSPGK